MSTTVLSTGKDVLEHVLLRAEELSLGLGDRETEAKAYVQSAYLSIVGEGFPWAWAKKEGVLVTASEVTGAVQVTSGSSTITFGDAVTPSMVGRRFVVESHGIVCRILSHTSGSTSATLDSIYPGESGSGLAFSCRQDIYALASDVLSPIGKRFLSDSEDRSSYVGLVNEEVEIDDGIAQSTGSERPEVCIFTGTQLLRLAPPPMLSRRYEYSYIRHPGELDFSGITAEDSLIIRPLEDSVSIAFMAITNLLIDKNDERFQVHAALYKSKIESMRRTARKFSSRAMWVPLRNSMGARR